MRSISSILVSILIVLGSSGAQPVGTQSDVGWVVADEILKHIRPPVFKDRDFPITDFGAVEGGVHSATAAIRAAIAACHSAGGGRVVVPPGSFLTGPIHLLSNVNLHVSKGATLLFSTNPDDYLPVVFTRWGGVEVMNYSPLIYAFEQHDIAVTGEGTLDGQGDFSNWWGWNRKRDKPRKESAGVAHLNQLAEDGVPVTERVLANGWNLRPSFIEPYRCRNVIIEGVRIRRSPFWVIHPVLTTNITIRGIDVASHGPNNDGCDPESCRDVLIEDCVFDTGDDCIAIKSGRDRDGRRLGVPCENIIIRRCKMMDGHGAVVIGSEITGGARNIFVADCEMSSPKLLRALRIKSNARRGGLIENIHLRNIKIGHVAHAVIQVSFHYEENSEDGDFLPVVRQIEMENVTCEEAAYVLFMQGYANSPIHDIVLRNCRFEGIKRPCVLRHVRGLVFDDVELNASTPVDKFGVPLELRDPQLEMVD